jgi:hypothetical protein
MELNAVELALGIFDGADRRFSGSRDNEAFGRPAYVIAVTHPNLQDEGQAGKQLTVALNFDFGLSVLASVGWLDLAAQEMSHKLNAVTNAEHWHTHFDNSTIGMRRAFLVN